MKRFCLTLFAILLPLMVVYLSAGVSLTHCLHSGATKINTTASCGCSGDKPCGDCMEYMQARLSTAEASTTIDTPTDSGTDVLASTLPIADALAELTSAVADRHISERCKVRPPVPPRCYLSRIQVLII